MKKETVLEIFEESLSAGGQFFEIDDIAAEFRLKIEEAYKKQKEERGK